MERWRLAARALAKTMAWSMCALVAVGSGGLASAGATTLPDGRAYELVSPPGKNGADILVDSVRTRAASDGRSVAFASLGAFGDAIGTGIGIDYLSVRSSEADPGTNGWTTHAITPAQHPLSFSGILINGDPVYIGLSSDLSRGVFRAWSPVTDEPDVAKTLNLYMRSDIGSAGAGVYQLVTTCPLCAVAGPLPTISSPREVPVYAGASRDFTHVAFESQVNLTTDAPAQPGPRAYEWDGGQLRFVGYIPAGSDTSCGGAGPACVAGPASLPGQGLGTGGGLRSRPVNVLSSDGARIFFTVPTDDSGGVSLFARTGRIYVRTAGTTTDELTASERSGAPDAYAPAKYWGASVDGSRVFFTTGQALTDDAQVGGGQKLYMYDTTRAASDDHNLTLLNVDGEPADGENNVGQVMVISDDGRYVYFIAAGQLVSGEPVLHSTSAFYVWHDGDIAFIGRNSVDEGPEIATTDGPYILAPPQVRITPDGRHMLLSNHDGSGFSLGYDHGTSCSGASNGGCRELYVYNADTKTLTCASCDPSRVTPATDAATSVRPAGQAAATTWNLNRAITDDGSRVFFTTGEPLAPQDTNGKNDVYQYDVPTGQLHLISSGRDPSDADFMDASSDGRDVFFLTRERLVGWDVDASYDLYDARVGGGFPEPLAPAARCSGPACQGAAPAPPSAARMGSNVLGGDGGLAPVLKPHPVPRVCKRGFVKKRVRGKRRCVKRKRHRAKHASKRVIVEQQRRAK